MKVRFKFVEYKQCKSYYVKEAYNYFEIHKKNCFGNWRSWRHSFEVVQRHSFESKKDAKEYLLYIFNRREPKIVLNKRR